jgi:hypothetical protein
MPVPARVEYASGKTTAGACPEWDGEGAGLVYDFHRYLGEGLFLVYVIIIGVILLMGRSGRAAPTWLTAISHGLLALQVALGVILLAEGHSVVWYHPVLGIAAMLAIGLTPQLRERLGRPTGTIASLAIIGVLTFLAMVVVRF